MERLKNSDLPFKMKANINGTELDVDLTDLSCETLELVVMGRFCDELLHRVCKKIELTGEDELTDEEFEEFRGWFNEYYGDKPEQLFEVIEDYPDFFNIARNRYCEILAARNKYYRVTIRATQEFEIYVRATDDYEAEQIAGDLGYHNLSEYVEPVDCDYEVCECYEVTDATELGCEEVFTADDV